MDNRDLKKDLSQDDEKDDDEYFEYVCAKSGSRPLFTGKKKGGKMRCSDVNTNVNVSKSAIQHVLETQTLSRAVLVT